MVEDDKEVGVKKKKEKKLHYYRLVSAYVENTVPVWKIMGHTISVPH